MNLRIIYLAFISFAVSLSADTLTSLQPGEQAPSTFEELWQNFDPRKDPLDIEILAEWEEEGAVIKVVRYCAGTFKGQKAMVAAIFGYPIGGTNLPALVNVHGGGQYADARASISNAKRGYATISVSWAGRLSSSQYKVNPGTVKLFWDNQTDDPDYKLTTDWGAVDGYHAPCRHPDSASSKVAPHELTLDAIDSPRNSLWFLATVAARRAITFLEEQPNVDPNRIGIYGHSMGGKITVLTAAADDRLKVAVPTCGGISDYQNSSEIYNATLGDRVNLSHITCPIFFISPSNDFHGEMYDLPGAVSLIKSEDYGISSGPQHNHQDSGQYIISGFRFIDHYLQGTTKPPAMPQTVLNLNTTDGIPEFSVKVDDSQRIASIDIYYTQQGGPSRSKDKDLNPRFKFWHHATAKNHGSFWSGKLPIYSTKMPLWVYANVTYKLDAPESATNYYYSSFTVDTMNISSLVEMVSAEDLQEAKVKATLKESTVIEDFTGDWKQEWFTYDPTKWALKTNKLYHPMWQAPESNSGRVKLALKVQSAEPNTLVIRIDSHATSVELAGHNQLETFAFLPSDFKNASGVPLENWNELQQLELAPAISISSKFNDNGITKTDRLRLGSQNWKGGTPVFKELSWVAGN
ncbi:acetylxylan esterase [Coraliomargarita sp. SDUM461004]|uniref:Acetylxylan esterase n=1 Tax=Thalassobacterium sedimentorum TaxID=3041258 RepID=A0ABU1AKQ8_9BACT|nr:acetylxylan esterase [Coraliomargarita sp. SDUM461004]MDQ8195373.1 acetylxylan esterase [Coraliomargarita sp. SDUM461004]